MSAIGQKADSEIESLRTNELKCGPNLDGMQFLDGVCVTFNHVCIAKVAGNKFPLSSEEMIFPDMNDNLSRQTPR